MRAPLLVQISDRAALSEDELARRLGGPRALTLLVRDKDLDGGARAALADRLAARARAAGRPLWIAADVALARSLGADGVHLPSGAGAAAIAAARAALPHGAISVACHDVADVVRAAEGGASVALLSPIFASPGKGAPIGLGALGEARTALAARGLDLALVALGGVTAERVARCLAAGADGAAAIRADLSRAP